MQLRGVVNADEDVRVTAGREAGATFRFCTDGALLRLRIAEAAFRLRTDLLAERITLVV